MHRKFRRWSGFSWSPIFSGSTVFRFQCCDFRVHLLLPERTLLLFDLQLHLAEQTFPAQTLLDDGASSRKQSFAQRDAVALTGLTGFAGLTGFFRDRFLCRAAIRERTRNFGSQTVLSERFMTLQYMTDEQGAKTAVVVPLREFEDLMEDIEDLAAAAERRGEETLSHDEVLKELKADGLI